MKNCLKKVAAMSAALFMMGTMSVMGASAVVLEKTFNYQNAYLSTTQTYGYDSDTATTFASNLTKCKKSNYSAILSSAEITDGQNMIYANATDFRPTADIGSFIKVTSHDKHYYTGRYAHYWSYVADENDVVRGNVDLIRKIKF